MVKTLIRLLLLGTLILLAFGLYTYFNVVTPVVIPEDGEAVTIQIAKSATFEEVLAQLEELELVQDATAFTLLAKRMNYHRNPMRSGRFTISPGSTMVEMIRHLRGGKQATVDVVLTTEREPMNVAAKVARFIEPDSTAIVSLLQDKNYLDSIGYSKETLMTLFIPNTYEFYWNTTPRAFVERMIKEHRKFWSADRKAKAEKLGLNPAEVYTLASIVERETLRNDEKQRMAGVYHNRILIGMLLQADPTAVFASRDFNTTRVTNYHLSIDSPYNTYKYTGLPPGPISMSSISSIDAVLNRESHDYLYFCAKGDGSGYHNFAKTLAAHNRNAAIYRANLRKRGKR